MNYNTMTIESLSDNVFRQSEFKVNKADLIERITYLIEQAKTKQLILSGVARCVCKIPEPRLKVSENGTYAYCEKCAKTYVRI